jgi:hypothetical protein
MPDLNALISAQTAQEVSTEHAEEAVAAAVQAFKTSLQLNNYDDVSAEGVLEGGRTGELTASTKAPSKGKGH